MKKHRSLLIAVVALALALGLAACGGGGGSTTGGSETSAGGGEANAGGGEEAAKVSGSVTVAGVWTGAEQKSFESVIEAFEAKNPEVSVKYEPDGDNLPTILSTAVEGGSPPDIATIAQPALIEEFQRKGALEPIDYAKGELEANYSPDFIKLGQIDGKQFDFVFKGANKSTVWYNVPAYEAAGVEPPKTFEELLEDAQTLKASGVPAFSIAGADGWTLTDLFENIYLRQAGGDKYSQLSEHKIKWTDPSVKKALETMAELVGDKTNVAEGDGALQVDFPTSVANDFSEEPKAATVIEGDFVPGVIEEGESPLKAETGYNTYPFPSVEGSEGDVVGGGDSVAVFNDSPAIEAFVKFLASPEGAEVWVKRGGFSSPNKGVPSSAYPDAISLSVAQPLAEAKTFRFDMSDLAPISFGGTPGQGEWKILQDFFANPSDIDGTAQKLETAAAKAYAE
jgi:alpha-glucoside transport system substrate-binding protein